MTPLNKEVKIRVDICRFITQVSEQFTKKDYPNGAVFELMDTPIPYFPVQGLEAGEKFDRLVSGAEKQGFSCMFECGNKEPYKHRPQIFVHPKGTQITDEFRQQKPVEIYLCPLQKSA